MSLADIVPIALATTMERRPAKEPGRAAAQRRYQQKNRKRLNAYQREWYHRRKAA